LPGSWVRKTKTDDIGYLPGSRDCKTDDIGNTPGSNLSKVQLRKTDDIGYSPGSRVHKMDDIGYSLGSRVHNLFVCLFVYSRTSNFSAIWRLSPLPVTGLPI
jgi:hypothetical protein